MQFFLNVCKTTFFFFSRTLVFGSVYVHRPPDDLMKAGATTSGGVRKQGASWLIKGHNLQEERRFRLVIDTSALVSHARHRPCQAVSTLVAISALSRALVGVSWLELRRTSFAKSMRQRSPCEEQDSPFGCAHPVLLHPQAVDVSVCFGMNGMRHADGDCAVGGKGRMA